MINIICNVMEKKKDDGTWYRNYIIGDTKYMTRCSLLWGNLTTRLKSREEGKNLFNGYDEFVGWCIFQKGFDYKDSYGRYWALEKDILDIGNKDYGPHTCCFVPQAVNNLLMTNTSTRGEYLIGVCSDKERGGFISGIKSEGKRKFLGRYKTEFAAHKAWQEGKVIEIENTLGRYDLDIKVVKALTNQISKIKGDIADAKPTNY